MTDARMTASVTHRISETQPGLRLSVVENRADRARFVEFPYTLYKRTPHWVPPLRRDEYHRLSPRHNPFHEHADIRLWLAWVGQRVVGRVAAIDDRLHNATHGELVTWFGFFEAENEPAALALLQAVERHAVTRGSAVVRGPANPSLNDSVGLLIDAFDEDPYVLMPYNPPQYARFIAAAGFVKAKDLLAWDIDATAPLGARVQRVGLRLAARQGVSIRSVAMTRAGFDRDLEHLKAIYRAAWTDNWGFVEPTDAEIRQFALELKPVIDPEMVLFAESDGAVVGCAVAVPDLNQVLKKMNGRLLPFGLVHFLRRKSIVNRVRVLLLGVLPAYRRRGIYPLMIAELQKRAVAQGYRRAELSWTLEDNDLVNAGIEAAGGHRYKTYRLYEKPVG
jgi:GNAT superfamily N-acetyltransferase